MLLIDETKTKIRNYIIPHMQGYNLRDDEDIFSLDYINSLFAMQLVLFVEHEFKIVVENEDLDIRNFRSVDNIANLVAEKSVG